MQYYLLCASHVGMNFENSCCVLVIPHVPSKALLEVFFLLQGISLDDSNVTFAIHLCKVLPQKKTHLKERTRGREGGSSYILETYYIATDT